MKKILLIFLNIIVLTSVITAVYHFYLAERDSNLNVDCDYQYVLNSNSMELSCNVEDDDQIISEDYPLSVFLFNSDDSVVFEGTLEEGINNLDLTDLDNNSLYSISIEGYDFIKDDYILTIYSEFDFSTIKEDFVEPDYTYTENLVTDTVYSFSVDIADLGCCATSIDITLLNNLDEIIITQNFTEYDDLDFSFTELTPNKEYTVELAINYVINDYGEISVLSIPVDFTTLEEQLSPFVEISNMNNNNVDLTFDLLTNDNDATDVVYTIELIDPYDSLIYSSIVSSTDISIDVSGISGNYYLSIKASYSLNSIDYEDIELTSHNIYTSVLSNFFVIPTLSIVNTDLPLTSYDDYADYIFTFLNQESTEFSIECESPVDCSELVTNELYSFIPFEVTDFVHAYNDLTSISYSYTSTELNIVVGRQYTLQDMQSIDQEVEIILNLIITESMTDYDKIEAIHNYVVNNTVYDEVCYDNSLTCDNDHTAIGVFVDGYAVCEGYAHAIDIMLRAIQIPTFKLSSDTHQWNAVYYDGGWYHLDATWDDPVSNSGQNTLSDTYFLIDSAQLYIEDSSGSHVYSTIFINFME